MKIRLFVILALLFSLGFATTLKNGSPIRADKRSASEVVDTAKPDQKVEVVEKYHYWTKISIVSGSDHAGKSGWIYTKLLDGENIGGEGSNIRAEANGKSAVLFKVRSGAKIKILDAKYAWYKISYDGKTGWVYESNVVE